MRIRIFWGGADLESGFKAGFPRAELSIEKINKYVHMCNFENKNSDLFVGEKRLLFKKQFE